MRNPKFFFFVATIVLLISAFFAGNPQNTFHNHNNLQLFPIQSAVGPESFSFDPLHTGPYTGISDGRIIKWDQNQRRWIDFALTSANRDACHGQNENHAMEHICGRPLGMSFHVKTGHLYIADAYMGLLVVGSDGGLATAVATQAQGVPFGFTNSLDIDQETGVIYFTDSSSLHQRRNYVSVILSGDNTGRLMKYDIESRQVTVLLTNLSFPNGVSLSKNMDYILVVETTKCRIMRYWLKTPKTGRLEVFAEIEGFGDNIKRSPRGGYWVGIHSKRSKVLEWVLSYPWIGNLLIRVPINIMRVYSSLSKWKPSGFGLKLSEEGEMVEVLKEKRLWSISEVDERDGQIWVGSVNMPFAAVYNNNSPSITTIN